MRTIALPILLATWLMAADTTAQLPFGFGVTQLLSGLAKPTSVVFLPDGRGLVAQFTGKIFLVDTSQSPPFTKTVWGNMNLIAVEGLDVNGERGLMDLKLDPAFPAVPYVWVYYGPDHASVGNSGAMRVSKLLWLENFGALTSRAGPETVVWTDPQNYVGFFHYGAQITFGPEGFVYLAVGDKYDFPDDAQNLQKTGGKIFRLKPDGTAPADNFGVASDPTGVINDYIWAYGIRNPFRSFWDLPTNRYFISEVGGNDWLISHEDLHLGKAGVNYGWPLCEGNCNNPDFPLCDCAKHDNPLFTYPHAGQSKCLIGGFVYRGSNFPASYTGVFFFADWSESNMYYLTFSPDGKTVVSNTLFTAAYQVQWLGVNPKDGALYYAGGDGTLNRIVYTAGNQPPIVSAVSALPLAGVLPLAVAFSVVAVDAEGASLTTIWTFGDGTTSMLRSPTHIYETDGLFSAFVKISDGYSTSTSNAVTIAAGTAPVVNISVPANGAAFNAMQTLVFSGQASLGGVPMNATTLVWRLRIQHGAGSDQHYHTTIPDIVGNAFSFDVLNGGHAWDGAVQLVADLTATAASGLSTTSSVTLIPRKVFLSFQSSLPSVAMLVNGLTKVSPFLLDSLVRFINTIDAPAVVCVDGVQWTFSTWSGGLPRFMSLVTPLQNTTYVATFVSLYQPCTPPVAVFLGCFKDDGSVRDLPLGGGAWGGAGWVSNTLMTAALCMARCAPVGASYFGVQYGSECYCGSRYGQYGPSSACTMPCPGNKSLLCGGKSANSVFRIDNGGIDRRFQTLGCYSDFTVKGGPYLDTSVNMAPIVCHQACRDFQYFALQGGVICGCSNTLPVQSVGMALCNGSCTDAVGSCGGRSVRSVFRNCPAAGCAAVSTSTAGATSTLGQLSSLPTLTAQSTIKTTQAVSLGSTTTALRTLPTSSVSTRDTPTTTLVATAPSTSATTPVSARPLCDPTTVFVLRGCWLDATTPRRDLPFQAFASVKRNTLDICARACRKLKYVFAGAQFGVQCWCGNTIGLFGAAAVPAASCDMACGGNAFQLCGGSFANSVIQVGCPLATPAVDFSPSVLLPAQRRQSGSGHRGLPLPFSSLDGHSSESQSRANHYPFYWRLS